MPDSKFYRAQTARARCEAGQFVLMGRVLRVFSLTHFALLDELLGDDIWDAEADAATLDIISRICSRRRPGDELEDIAAMTQPQRDRYGHSLLQFDLAAERSTWAAYMALCFLSRPRTRQATGGNTIELRAPFALIVGTYVLRHLHGISHDALWLDWPVGQVLWQYESAREQISEVTTLAASDEPDPEPTPEEKATDEKHAALAEKIISAAMEKHAFAESAAEHGEIEAEQTRLLMLAQLGKLNDDLSENV